MSHSLLFRNSIDQIFIQIDLFIAPGVIFSANKLNKKFRADINNDFIYQSAELNSFPYQYGMIKQMIEYFQLTTILDEPVIVVEHNFEIETDRLKNKGESLMLNELLELGFKYMKVPSEVFEQFEFNKFQ